MKRLLIVQPYVPMYRVPFFEKLIPRLRMLDVECHVSAALPLGAQAARGDSVGDYPWLVRTANRPISLGGVDFQRTLSNVDLSSYDGYISGLMGSSLDTYRCFVSRFAKSKSIGLWGHVGAYTKGENRIDVGLETLQMRLADQVFAYTEGGAGMAVSRGISKSKIVAVQNTVDIEPLVRAMAEINVDAQADFMSRYNLVSGKVLSFVGGIDSSKRIDSLASILEALWCLDPEFKLLVGGIGEDEWLLNASVERGQSILLGRVGDSMKAFMGRASVGILMPGRVGLVAVEALAMGLPIYTDADALHAPEYEYLDHGVSVFHLDQCPERAAEFIVHQAGDFGGHSSVRSNWYPSMDSMVENFATGVVRMFA